MILKKLEWQLPPSMAREVEKSRNALADRLSTFAGGAIILTFTAIQLLDNKYHDASAIKISWIFFILTILAGILRDVLAINLNTSELAASNKIPDKEVTQAEMIEFLRTTEGEKVQVLWRFSLRWGGLLAYIEITQMFLFLAGLISIVVFGWVNF